MKSPVKFGLFTGILSGVWVISCFSIVSWLNHSMELAIPAFKIRAYSGLFSIIILVLGIYLGIMDARRKKNNQISYAETVKTGVIVSVITGVLVAIFSYLYCTAINPGYTAYMVKEAEKALLTAHEPPEKISRELIKVKQQFSTSSQVMMALLGQVLAGTVSSLIIGFFVRNKTNPK